MPLKEITDFLEIIKQSLDNNKLIRVVLSNKRDKASEVKNVHVKPAIIKKTLMLSFVSRYPTKDITKNYSINEGIELIVKMLEKDFSQADIFNTDEDIFLIDRNNKYKMARKMHDDTVKPSLEHDQTKKYLITAENNIYLRELGITTAEGKVKNDMNDKFKQINKYIEIIESIIKTAALPENFSVYDMGAGKGYLTFALYDHFVNHLKLKANITGIELRKELAESSNLIASKSDFKNLNFMAGTIGDVKLTNADILIALHACDTATDDAIAKGIESEAKVIICAPCCHKQVRKNMEPAGVITNITRHGILFERQAEILTDTIRAMIMEAHGYRTKVFEFISQEHTSKNLLIAGVKERKPDKETIKAEIQKLKEIFGVKEHYLEKCCESIVK